MDADSPADAAPRWTRRGFFGVAAAITAACTGSESSSPTTLPPDRPTTTTRPPVGPYPFTLGVASGDPDDESVVLWTRSERDGDIALYWEVSESPEFETLVVSGNAMTTADTDHTVKVIAGGLAPDSTYWFRFEADGHWTTPARTRTAPETGQRPDQLVVAQVSCQRRSSGYWTAYDDLVAEAPDLVVHCGDYIYEIDRDDVRPDDDPEAVDLAGYRATYRKYKADPSLQAAHAVAPFLCVWDDHEVDNNQQGADPDTGDPTAEFELRRAAAYQAWWEYQPTRVGAPDGTDVTIHRTVDWGDLARFTLLDTRTYRDDQPCGEDLGPRCDATTAVSMLGADQEAWFDDQASTNPSRWFVAVQQVMVQQWRLLPGNSGWNLDAWDGYTGARARLLQSLAKADDAVVLTGDLHSSWVGELHASTNAATPPDDFDDPSAPVVGVEFVGPGISSRVPDRLLGLNRLVELQNDHLKWSEARRRGWVRHDITPDRWTATYRLVDDADVPGSTVESARTITIRHGKPGVDDQT